MIHFKPTPVKAVEITPAQKRQPVVLKRRFKVHPDGTVSPVEDHLDWDIDKPNRLGE